MPPSTVAVNVNADKMAAETIQYMNIFEQHVAHVRGHHDAYQRILDQGRALPPDFQWPSLDSKGEDKLRSRMEEIIHSPATTVDE